MPSLTRLTTFAVWAAAAAVAAYWSLQLLASPDRARSAPIAEAALPVADAGSVARLLGVQPGPTAAPALASRSKLALLGLVDQRQGSVAGGSALIVVDDGPARPFRMGEEVADGYRLGRIDGTEHVTLVADGQPDWVLDMPTDFTSGKNAAPNVPGRSSGVGRPMIRR